MTIASITPLAVEQNAAWQLSSENLQSYLQTFLKKNCIAG